jgi:hypothetical protein
MSGRSSFINDFWAELERPEIAKELDRMAAILRGERPTARILQFPASKRLAKAALR